MSLIDVTHRLSDEMRETVIQQILEQEMHDRKLTVAPQLDKRRVKVSVTRLPQVGTTNPEGAAYTYCLSAKTVILTYAKSGNLGRFTDDELACTALISWLDGLLMLDLRNIVKYAKDRWGRHETHLLTPYRTLTSYCPIPGTNQKWKWLEVSSALLSREKLFSKELVQGEVLSTGEPELVNTLFYLTQGLRNAKLWNNSCVMDQPTRLFWRQNLGYYYPTNNPEEYVAVTVKATIPKEHVLDEMRHLFKYIV